MKKRLALVLTLLLLTSCGGQKTEKSEPTPTPSRETVSASISPSPEVDAPTPKPEPLATLPATKFSENESVALLLAKDLPGFGVVKQSKSFGSSTLGGLEKAYNSCLLDNAPDLVKIGTASQINGDRYQKNLINAGLITIDSQITKSNTPEADVAYMKNNTVYQSCFKDYIASIIKDSFKVKNLDISFETVNEKEGVLYTKIVVEKSASFTGFDMLVFTYTTAGHIVQYTVNIVAADDTMRKENSEEIEMNLRKVIPTKKAGLK